MLRIVGLVLLAMILALPAWGQPMNGISLDVLEPAERTRTIHDFPVSVGLIFPKGDLKAEPYGKVVDGAGTPVPCETEVTGWWEKEKRNVKWLLLHFRASTDKKYFFVPGEVGPGFQGKVLATEQKGAIAVDTGPMKVVLSANKPELFTSILFKGKEIMGPGGQPVVLMACDEKGDIPGTLKSFSASIEKNTPFRATVKTSCLFVRANGKPLARVDTRLKFYRGETFFRVLHTMTWMVDGTDVGIRELGLAFTPNLETGNVSFGLDEYGDTAFKTSYRKGDRIELLQDAGERFRVEKAGETITDGKTMGGCVTIEDDDGTAMSISLRHAWQRYPTSFSVENGRLSVGFWPKSVQPLSFKTEDIMGPYIFSHPSWVSIRRTFARKYKRKIPRLGPIDTTRAEFFDYLMYSDRFTPTPEGCAITHEMLVSFHDRDSPRSPAVLNSLTQHPVVLRQDPQYAMKSPFMGFNILPCSPKKYPNMERAIDKLGKISMARWVQEFNFGLLRFGMVRWGQHSRKSYYRWMDNAQYDQQLIPWLLFMRGGDRSFFDDAEIVSRQLMDLGTNHYNSRGVETGYMAGARHHIPFPREGFNPAAANMKFQKIHYLSYYYHLTGYERAKDVMEEVIRGTTRYSLARYKALEKQDPKKGHYNLCFSGRNMFNMNVFWSNAYEETFDPDVKFLFENNLRCTTDGEYVAEKNAFKKPTVYLYNGLVPMYRISRSEKLKDIMLQHLQIDTLDRYGGVKSGMHSIGHQLAYELAADKRYAVASFDIARGLADQVPDIDLTEDLAPFYPKVYVGSSLYRCFLLPILVGLSMGDELSLDVNGTTVFQDNFFHMIPKAGAKGVFSGTAFVQPRAKGTLTIRIMMADRKDSDAQVRIHRNKSETPIRDVTMRCLTKDRPSGYAAFDHLATINYWKEFTVDDATPADVFRVVVEKDSKAFLAFMGDGRVVQYLPTGQGHSNMPLGGAQYYTPQRLYTMSTADTISHRDLRKSSITIRDAKTNELLYRPQRFTPEEGEVEVGKDRMIYLTLPGARSPAQWKVTGMSPYFSCDMDSWFNPEQ